MSAPRRLAAAVSVPAALTFLAAGLAVAVPATAATEGYQGTSFPIKIQVGLAGSSLLDEILPGVVSFPSGGDTSLLELPTELSEVARLKVLNAVSGVKDQTLASNARTAQLSVLNDLVTASVLNADCTAANLTLAGDSQVTNLAVAGTKIPIDPGPNFKIEIPTALAPFLSGGIYIDEQETLPTGDLRDRALQVRLVVDPLGLQTVLNGVIGDVRKVAEQVKGAVETATGRTLDVLETEARDARGVLAPAAAVSTTGDPVAAPTTGDPVAGSSAAAAQKSDAQKSDAQKSGTRDAGRDEVRAAVEHQAAEKAAQQAAQKRLVAQRDAEAAAAEAQAVDAQRRADAASTAAAEVAARDSAAEQAGAEDAAGEAAGGTTVKKADPAAVDERDAAAEAARAKAQSSSETWQQRANRLRPQQVQDAAAKAQAEAVATRKAADAAHARAAAARAGKVDTGTARHASSVGAGSVGAGKVGAGKVDRAAVAAPQRAAVPAADPGNLGTVGVDVIVSQVTCKGFQAVQAVNKPPAKTPPAAASSVDKPDLPKTGGNGDATTAVGAVGLGLLLGGAGVVYAVRRRRHSA